MAQSFLNQPGLPLGLRNNNPGNLRPLPGGQKWLGEITPDYTNNFSRFENVAYGLRAMITDITGDIVKDGDNTIRKLVNKYAPPSDNNPTQAYINYVSAQTGWNPDQVIIPSEENIKKLIRAKMNFELGAGNASLVNSQDISEAFSLISSQVRGWLNMVANAATSGPGAALLLAILAGLIIFRKNLFS